MPPALFGPVACVLLRALPIAAHHGIHRADESLAVHKGKGKAARIEWCNLSAERAGVQVGQTLAAAQARDATLRSARHDDVRLARTRRQVIASLLQVTPRVRAAGAQRFWAEPVGKSFVRWGEAALASLSDLRPVSIGIADNATLAHAASQTLPEGCRYVPSSEAPSFLDNAPLHVLEIEPEARVILASLGIHRVGELRQLDPISLGMRFGPAVAEARRRADGWDRRAPQTPKPEPSNRIDVDLDDPIASLEALMFLLRPALERLLAPLRQRSEGVTLLSLRLLLDRASEIDIPVRSAEPMQDARTTLELLRLRLEELHLPGAIRGFQLDATERVEHQTPNETLAGIGPRIAPPGASSVALERLRGRLGADAIRRAESLDRGHPLERARWRTDEASRLDRSPLDPTPTEPLPWRKVDPPVLLVRGGAVIAGRRRQLLRLSRIERSQPTWWNNGKLTAELLAWGELDGPLFALLRGTCNEQCDDRWEVIAWLD